MSGKGTFSDSFDRATRSEDMYSRTENSINIPLLYREAAGILNCINVYHCMAMRANVGGGVLMRAGKAVFSMKVW